MSTFDLESQLTNYAQESGDIPLPYEGTPAELVSDVVADELAVSQGPGLGDLTDAAIKANDVADQLEALADRAEAVPTDSASVVAISAESLHREFEAIMAGNSIRFRSTSFESARTDASRLTGISKDARMIAKHSRTTARDLLDTSNEAGAVVQFLRRDKSRLAAAKKALEAAKPGISAKTLDESGVVIKHNGAAVFLTRNGKPVTNIHAGVTGDAEVLSKIHGLAETIGARCREAAAQLKAGNIPKVDLTSLYAGVNALATEKGGMLGNYTIKAVEREGKTPKLARVSYNGGLKNIRASISGGKWVLLGAAALATGGAAGLGVAGAAGALAMRAANKKINSSDAYSASTGGQLVSAIDTVLGFEKYTTFKYDWEAEKATLKDVDDAIGAADKDKKKALTAAYGDLEDAYSLIFRLIDIAYEQAIYDMVNMAQLAKAAAKK